MIGVYRLLLRLFLPAGLRASAEAELVEVFRDGLAAARRAGSGAVIVFVWRALLDLVLTGVAERREQSASAATRSASLTLDLRAGLRDVRRSAGTSALSVVTLGLGIAATVLIGVLVRDVLLQPLPFDEPDRLVRLLEQSDEGGTFWPSYENMVDWREQAPALEGVVAASVGTVKPVLLAGSAYRAVTGEVSRDFFQLLGVDPVAGRFFLRAENERGAPPVVVIGEEFWATLGRPSLAELNLRIGTDLTPVVGVAPAGFRFLGHGNAWLEADVWVPLERVAAGGRRSHGYHTVARLRSGLTLAAARASMDDLAGRLKLRYGDDTDADEVTLEPLSDAVIGTTRAPLRLLAGASLVVLLIAILNLGATLLARGITRDQGLAVRSALGARRGDLVRLQLVHAGLLAVPGAALGAGLTWISLRAIRALGGGAIPRLDGAALDPLALAGAAGIALVAALLAGVLPAVALSRTATLSKRIQGRGTTRGRPHNLLWDLFVGGQIALTLGLLVAAGLLVRSMVAALDVDLGYEPAGVLLAELTLPESRYEDAARRVTFYDEVMRRLRASPAIDAAGLVSTPPDEIFAYISPAHREGVEGSRWAGFRLVDDGYFETLRIPVEEGALSASADAVLVDRNLSNSLWPDESPLGDRVASNFIGEFLPIAGLVGGIREWRQTEGGLGAIYLHYARRPGFLLRLYVVARGPSRQHVATALRDAVSVTDPMVPIAVEVLEDRLSASMSERRLMLAIAIGFAAIALLLAAAGVHSLITHGAAQRRRETGIRIILGESLGSIRRRVLGVGLRAAVLGVVVGAILALAGAWALRSQLFGVSPLDPAGVGGAALVLLAIAGLAAWLPARRATRTDPARLLRDD